MNSASSNARLIVVPHEGQTDWIADEINSANILELDRPFDGFIQISSQPMRAARQYLGQ
jgi:hypothetical protein